MRRIPGRASGKMFIKIGAPVNWSGYVDRGTAIELLAGPLESFLTHAFDLKFGKQGIAFIKQEPQHHDTERQKPSL